MKINKKIIKELSDYLEEFNLTELEYTEKDTKIKVSKNNISVNNQNIPSAKTNINNSGQRYYTCIIVVSNSTTINFLNLKIIKKLERKSILFYDNILKDSNERNPDMKKFFSNIEDSVLMNLYILKK